MKKWIMTAVVTAAAVGTALAAAPADKNAKKADTPPKKKEVKPLPKVVWETDYNKALQRAKKERKFLLIDFSGSDWCIWCKRLEHEVFSRRAFLEYAQKNLVLLLVDFPRDPSALSPEQRKQNEMLARQFGIRGFPTVIIMDPDGRPIAQTGYREGGAEAYVRHLESIIRRAKEVSGKK